MKARLALLATMSVVVGLNACGDPTNLQANLPTTVDTLSVFALSGTPPTYPSGISLVARQAVRVDGFASFDVAFDINAAGNAVIYPVKLVVLTPGNTRAVGFIKVAGVFDQVLAAPKTGFGLDTGIVMVPGEVVVVQSAHNLDSDLCVFAINPNLYAKFTVDSVNLSNRLLYLRMGLDPNCGFRSFATGIPAN
jgi:hypothetical protein